MKGPGMTVSITLAPDVEAKVRDRAAALGTDVEGYVKGLVERSVEAPVPLEQISGDVAARFDRSGMSDEELSDVLEREKHEARRERRGRRAS
jgi:hypothetical protein